MRIAKIRTKNAKKTHPVFPVDNICSRYRPLQQTSRSSVRDVTDGRNLDRNWVGGFARSSSRGRLVAKNLVGGSLFVVPGR